MHKDKERQPSMELDREVDGREHDRCRFLGTKQYLPSKNLVNNRKKVKLE